MFWLLPCSYSILLLLATSSSRRGSTSNRKNKIDDNGPDNLKKGRGRYSRDGRKRRKSNENSDNKKNEREELIVPLPPLTTSSSTLTYFSCRHSYEDILMEEIQSLLSPDDDDYLSSNAIMEEGLLYSPCPGLVRVDSQLMDQWHSLHDANVNELMDPVYALQIFPNVKIVEGSSISQLSQAICDVILASEDEESMRKLPKGTLRIHSLVPGMCKGQTKPKLLSRSQTLGSSVLKSLQSILPAARTNKNTHDIQCLVQIMLQSPTIAIVSLAFLSPSSHKNWPNAYNPLGLVNVNIESRTMPSSAYRKVMEAMECMKCIPQKNDIIYDLGACPGGWTSVFYHDVGIQNTIYAIDRSPLDPSLMKNNVIQFIQGDAFAFQPPTYNSNSIDIDTEHWMVSDVIAYPSRCIELLQTWCQPDVIVSHMIVTMKFQSHPTLHELQSALAMVRERLRQRENKTTLYSVRAKHFFSNKNEVTIMIHPQKNESTTRDLDDKSENGNNIIGTPLYPSAMFPSI